VTRNPVSPFSTSGGGFIFEYRVAAIMLCRLIRGASVPVGLHEPISRVAFQQSNEGFPLDDVVAHADPYGSAPSIQVQVKRTIQITAGDPDFIAVMRAAVDVCREHPEQVASGQMLLGLATRGPANHLEQLTDLTKKARAHADLAKFSDQFRAGVTGKPMRDRFGAVSAAVATAADISDGSAAGSLTHQILKALHVWQVAEGPDGRDWRAELDSLADLASGAGKAPVDLMQHLYSIVGEFAPQSGLVDAEHVRKELVRFGVYLSPASTGIKQQGSTFTVNNNGSGPVFQAGGNQYFPGLRFGYEPPTDLSRESGQHD
jgi:hypothetical protein